MIGNNNDRNLLESDIENYLNEIDRSFETDLGFSFRNLISVQKLLSSWTYFDSSPNEKEATSYKANEEEIIKMCEENIEDFEKSKASKILQFLTLDSNNLLLVEGSSIPAPDLPVWEHRKRTFRYSLRPLIKIENEFYWGAYSLERSGRTWFTTISNHKLPSDISVPNTTVMLDKYHSIFTNVLQDKIEEIVSRFTPLVETEIFPMNLGFCNEDIGDIDVFALLETKNILLNIESKVIDQVFCNKDLKRLSEKIFGRIKMSDGEFKVGYLQKVEKRADLLEEKGKQIVEKIWQKSPENLRVISIFVTPESYWWTKYSPIKTNVNFIEIRLLENFLSNI